jgi:predicted acylesterase/phospholipase RssA
MAQASSIMFQSAKLGDVSQIEDEFQWAMRLHDQAEPVGRIYGVSGGSLVALAFGLSVASQRNPERWGRASAALEDFAAFVHRARSRDIRRWNLNPKYGFYNLGPLRSWLAARLRAYSGRDDWRLSDLGIPLYLCALDWDAVFTLFGPVDEALQFQYQWVRVGPPRDAPILDALLAALSTMLSTEPVRIGGDARDWFRDCRPAIVDASAIVHDLEAADSRPILFRRPHAPIRPWKLNWFTSSFIMHSQNERNQTLLAAYYLDLVQRQSELQEAIRGLEQQAPATVPNAAAPSTPTASHVDLPYVGSTEAFTNMRQSAEHKDELMARFRELLDGQMDHVPFDRPANVIYGAGGFSGILAGLVTTRAVTDGFQAGGGEIRQIYGVSAGVLNGFFHAVQVAAERHVDIYTQAAHNAVVDLEQFMSGVEPKKIAQFNYNPLRLWQGFGNLGPLEEFLLDRLSVYTGSRHPEGITFDDIALPLTVTAARSDGFTEFLGMTSTDRRMRFAGRMVEVLPAPIVQALLAGWSMNTYIAPTRIGHQVYQDGGGTFYDPGLFPACMDAELTNLLNVHLDEPDGHSYNLPPRPDVVRIVFDTHNYVFPEERRRMRALTDLLYEHYRLRACYSQLLSRLPANLAAQYPLRVDFRREWDPL